jgi:hypothetical protein
MTKTWIRMVMAGVTVSAAIAQAQPAPPDDGPPPPGDGSARPPPQNPPPQNPQNPTDPYGDKMSPEDRTHQDEPPPPPPRPPRPPDPPVEMPELLRSPTGWLLPAAVIYSKTALDTGGGLSSDLRVGLGDVAEFGVRSTDVVRSKLMDGDTSTPIQPYATATFRMGVSENRLFTGQPGVALGFEKSFQTKDNGFDTRIAALSLVASKRFGKRAAFHVGGAFWDAEIKGTNPDGTALTTTLHDAGVGKQIRAFGGIQLMPIDKSEILVDLSYAPEFCYGCTQQIALRPELSWGVRYKVADWMNLESGVRLPNIGKADLLDAEIFGAVTFTTWGLRHVVDDLK